MDQQLHNLSIEIVRLRTLADHSNAMIHRMAHQADTAERAYEIVVQKLDTLLGQRDTARRIVRKITVEVKPEKDTPERLGFEMRRLQSDVVESLKNCIYCDKTAEALNQFLDEIQTALDELGR